MERAIRKCKFCGSELKQVGSFDVWRCSSLECMSIDGSSISNVTPGTSLTLENLQATFKSVKNAVYEHRPKRKKGPPLTIDDILDFRQWSSKVQSNELYYRTRRKTKT